jgi:hypothetical protein
MNPPSALHARRKRIGLDFDNTLVGYDGVFFAAARERGLVSADNLVSKRAIRDAIRLLPEGELAWQRLQGYVYGAGIGGAKLLDGADGFLRRCRGEGHEIFIVSHKTEFGHHDPARVNLRDAALGWMEANGLFAVDGYAIPTANVFFESTRAAKLARIAAIGVTHFIDDLEEVLTDPGFPPGVMRVLLADAGGESCCKLCPTWQRVAEIVLDDPT